MGASVGSDDSGSVNVELNVVPFIDLMSCLTAFLLVTAVWSQYAQIKIKPKGLGRVAVEEQIEAEEPIVSLLLTNGEIWLGIAPEGERRQISNLDGRYDWASLEESLNEYRQIPALASSKRRNEIEIAAEDDVIYQDVISAMDYSVNSEFVSIGYLDPSSLSVRFKE
jgi:biopolymer transport protein ExbD